ncbi:hypothetical protein P171DRAFT_449995 [Karstenula rhodostoma CBS 690.94]|uniref:Uncharacterized protein n=1 Tax=Karstenula rhodostoma CBS 690.94 TaxID=1392251 RepID=A0A9P4P500_9PLEO|nr:hypothetical protein P171DRAFT_449995 [Karstenula rhodostoma CBS 690.94]
MATNPTIVENSLERFAWDGGWKGIVLGRHFFEFQPSKATWGHTTFVNREELSGVLMAINFLDKTRKAGPGFNMMSRDLKRMKPWAYDDIEDEFTRYRDSIIPARVGLAIVQRQPETIVWLCLKAEGSKDEIPNVAVINPQVSW